MATTFISYNIWYDNREKASAIQPSPLNVIYEGRTKKSIVGTGITTIATQNKFCQANIIVGNKTCATENKFCQENIIVNASAIYYWDRYYINISYAAKVSGRLSWRSNPNYYSFSIDHVSKAGIQAFRTFKWDNEATWSAFPGLTLWNRTNETFYSTNSCENYLYNKGSGSLILNNYPLQTFSASIPSIIINYDGWAGLCFTPEYTGTSYGTNYYKLNCLAWMKAGGWGFNAATLAISYDSSSDRASFYGQLAPNNEGYVSWGYAAPSASRGQYIDRISSSYSTAYPDNGISGSYWYTAI